MNGCIIIEIPATAFKTGGLVIMVYIILFNDEFDGSGKFAVINLFGFG